MAMTYDHLLPELVRSELYNYGKFDTELVARSMNFTPKEKHVSTNFMAQANWMFDQKAKAELEAHRERVRQVYARAFGVASKSSEWVQGLLYVEGAKTLEDLKRVCDSFDISWKDSGDMLTKSEEIAKLRAEAVKLNARIEKLELGRWGKEPANGSVFKIERRFERNGAGYTYAAVRAGGSWYLTGTRGDAVKAMTWDELKRWAGQYSRVWTMTVKEELVD